MKPRRTLEDSGLGKVLGDTFADLESGATRDEPDDEIDAFVAKLRPAESGDATGPVVVSTPQPSKEAPRRLERVPSPTPAVDRSEGSPHRQTQATVGPPSLPQAAGPVGAKVPRNIYLPKDAIERLRHHKKATTESFSELISRALSAGPAPASEQEWIDSRSGLRETGDAKPRMLRIAESELDELDRLAQVSRLPRNRMVVVLIHRFAR